MDDGSSATSFNPNRFTGPENELSELIWRNGHVVMQSQSNRKPLSIENESKLAQKGDEFTKLSLIQDDETAASWFPCVLDEFAIDKEFASYFFCDSPIDNDIVAGDTKSSIPLEETAVLEQPIPNLIFDGKTPCVVDSIPESSSGLVVNFSQFARPLLRQRGDKEGSVNADCVAVVGESSSMISIELSVSGSNQFQNQVDRSCNMSTDTNNACLRRSNSTKEDIKMSVPYDTVTVTSSSGGGSGCSFRRIRASIDGNQSCRKRKGRDFVEHECHSEDIEDESVEANKPVQRSTSTRRSRAAEVHNLSERRRRDRINEKMKALQELIPHCNKSDKASMLDEAIEYLKSLQQQVQIMWMGSGMVPMIFPGFQQYMSSNVGIGMGIDHAQMPSVPGQVQLPGVSAPSHIANQINFSNQMQNVRLPDQYAYHRIVPQSMNVYGYGSQTTQLNQTANS